MKSPKYSLIIPARNGALYLPACIETILSQDFHDYELILSDDNSTDGTADYFRSLNHPNVRVFFPEPGMSMAEHWEWALSKASGEWMMFIGQDDGVQSYFFELAEILTTMAAARKMRVIMSERAYYFWPGCEYIYGDTAISFAARPYIEICNGKREALWALLGFQNYFELPEMYTTSLFHRSLVEDAISRQEGKLFLAHPQDANLGAVACSLETHYLRSGIPLGWVGSSPKSAGMAIGATFISEKVTSDSATVENVRQDYLQKTSQSKIPYHYLAGDFSLASCALYFWGALLQTPMNYSRFIGSLLRSSIFKTILLAGVCAEVRGGSKTNTQQRWAMFVDVVNLNRCTLRLIEALAPLHAVAWRIWRLGRRIGMRVNRNAKPMFVREEKGIRGAWPELAKASHQIAAAMKEAGIIRQLGNG